jgi:hypothetical protein
MMFIIQFLVLILASQLSVVASYAVACADEPCTAHLGRNCTEALRLQLLYGSCCSLSDILNTKDDDCLLTVAGDNVECNLRDPDYQCIPTQGCLPEWNVLLAVMPNATCPKSKYEVPTEMPPDDAAPMVATASNTDSTEKKTPCNKGHKVRGQKRHQSRGQGN